MHDYHICYDVCMDEIGIASVVLKEILSGKKTIEVRLGKPRFLKLRSGDNLSLREDIWENGIITKSFSRQAVIKIKQILYFESFAEMFDTLDFILMTKNRNMGLWLSSLIRSNTEFVKKIWHNNEQVVVAAAFRMIQQV